MPFADLSETQKGGKVQVRGGRAWIKDMCAAAERRGGARKARVLFSTASEPERSLGHPGHTSQQLADTMTSPGKPEKTLAPMFPKEVREFYEEKGVI